MTEASWQKAFWFTLRYPPLDLVAIPNCLKSEQFLSTTAN